MAYAAWPRQYSQQPRALSVTNRRRGSETRAAVMNRDHEAQILHQSGQRLLPDRGQLPQCLETVRLPSLNLVTQPQELRVLVIGQRLGVTLRRQLVKPPRQIPRQGL